MTYCATATAAALELYYHYTCRAAATAAAFELVPLHPAACFVVTDNCVRKIGGMML
jgi:hypothetical protein